MYNNRLATDNLTIVVNSCDAYADVLKIFFYALRDNWPNCPYQIIINTESNTYSYDAYVHNFLGTDGKDDWGKRLLSTLNSINSEFVLMLYDDFILESPVSIDKIDAAINILKLNSNAAAIYLINTKLPFIQSSFDYDFVRLKDRINYKLNSAPAIWRKQSLIDYTFDGDTPWAWEVFGTYRTWNDGKAFYSLNPNRTDIYQYNHSKGGAIYRGKWVRDVVNKADEKYSLNIDWNTRGFSSDIANDKRPLAWKMKFIKTGFSMVGLKAIYYLISYLKDKIHAR